MQTLWSLLLAILGIVMQVLIFNRLHLWGGVAFVYLYALIKMPSDTPRILQIVLGFVIGFIIDCFCNTPGMHALACGTMMWMRMPLLHLFIASDDVKSGPLGMRQLGMSTFMRYLLAVTIMFCLVLYVVEAFSLFHFGLMLLKIVLSVLLTSLLIFVLEVANNSK
jgi:rod shape-determining protein MreD